MLGLQGGGLGTDREKENLTAWDLCQIEGSNLLEADELWLLHGLQREGQDYDMVRVMFGFRARH